MIVSTLFLVAGSIALYFGAEWIVKGSANFASRLGIPTLVIGLTVVAFGTSLPELIVSIIAAMEGSSAIAIGNIIGSNVANVGLVLGLSALIFPITINFSYLKRDIFAYLAICALFIFFILDGQLNNYEGTVFFIILILYIVICVKWPLGDNPETEEEVKGRMGKLFSLIAGGIILLALGAELFVDGAISLARYLGVSDVVIGMSVVAFGTSLPELSTSAIAAFRKESAISVGNIIGSNIFNILSVLGISSMLFPLNSPKEIVGKEVVFMVGYGIALILIAKMPQPISRITSSGLLLGYIFFIYLLF